MYLAQPAVRITTIPRQFFSKFLVIFSGLHSAVAARHNYKLADRAGLDGLHDLIRQSKDLLVRKTADDASGFDFLRRCTSLSLFDDGREVLDGSVLAFDVAASRITCGTGCPQSVLVGIGRRNDAVRGHENRSVEGLELLLLLPPCVSIVPCKVIVTF